MQFGVLGCGRMANERARSVFALGSRVSCVYDPDLLKAKAFAERYSVKLVAGTIDDIPWSKMDGVFVCTPPSSHTTYALAAVAAKLPFFIEKPLAVSSADCHGVLAALEHTPVLHGVGYMNRCRRSILMARDLLAQARILGACCHWLGRRYQVGWWLDSNRSGGPFNEQATHSMDLFRYLVGEISAVTATAQYAPEIAAVPVSVACAVTFAKGQLGTIFYSCEAQDKQINLRILTSDGMLEFQGWDLRLVTNNINGDLPSIVDEDIFVIETDRFIKALECNDQSLMPCDLFDGYRTQVVIDAARSSFVSGRSVQTETEYTAGGEL